MRSLRLVALSALAAAVVVVASPAHAPRKVVRPFLVYYGGLPANGGPALARRVAARFRGYPVVVFGWALRRARLALLVRRLLPRTRLYGYVDVGHVRAARVLAELRALGRLGFAGALLDDVGTGLSTRPGALQAVVDAAYRDRLDVLLNAWNPAPVLGLHLRPARSAILCENWVFSDGGWHAPRPRAAWADLRRLERAGVSVFMIVTAAHAPVAPAAVRRGVRLTAYLEFGQYLALSGPNYSADSDAVFPPGRLRAMLRALAF